MLFDQDGAVNREHVAEHVQKHVQPSPEVVNTGDRKHDGDHGSDDADEGSRDGLEPGVNGLCGEGEGVHIQNVIRNDPEGKDGKAQLTGEAERYEGCGE